MLLLSVLRLTPPRDLSPQAPRDSDRREREDQERNARVLVDSKCFSGTTTDQPTGPTLEDGGSLYICLVPDRSRSTVPDVEAVPIRLHRSLVSSGPSLALGRDENCRGSPHTGSERPVSVRPVRCPFRLVGNIPFYPRPSRGRGGTTAGSTRPTRTGVTTYPRGTTGPIASPPETTVSLVGQSGRTVGVGMSGRGT